MTKRIRKAALTLAWLIGALLWVILLMQIPQQASAQPELTPTTTPLSTETSTVTPTPTEIGGATETPTPTSTPDSQATSQVTMEPVTSETPTETATPTPDGTGTATATVTETPTPTATPDGTGTATPTATATDQAMPTATRDHQVYLPSVIQYVENATCPIISSNTYTTINIESGYYKNNRLTDENSDFRLSILGYAPKQAFLGFVNYDGDTDPHAPNFYNVLRSPAHPLIIGTYQRHDWDWDESGPPPYGTRGGVNTEWPASVIDLSAVPGESVFIPSRNIPINSTGPYAAMVLYADEDELTVSYGTHDSVADGYVVYLSNLCVDPSLVATYRAQLQNGFRFTGRLPVLLNTQPVGSALDNRVTLAVRDRAAFLDPRSEKDWWQNTAAARKLYLGP